MTAVPADTAPERLSLRTVVTDMAVVTQRNLRKLVRSPQLVVFSTIQPIMFVLLFNYVFGGAISGTFPADVDYINYLLPGIFVQTALFVSTNTGIALNEDLQKGIIDRFRSLPMARSAVLAGRTFADATRQLFVVLLMVAVSYVIGFRFMDGPIRAVLAVLLTVTFGFAFSWISANIGLRAPTAETAQTAGFIWVFPLVFASSAFVPTATMPGWMQAFANNQPVTHVANVIRALTLGDQTVTALGMPTAAHSLVMAALWIAGLLLVFPPLAIHVFRKAD